MTKSKLGWMALLVAGGALALVACSREAPHKRVAEAQKSEAQTSEAPVYTNKDLAKLPDKPAVETAPETAAPEKAAEGQPAPSEAPATPPAAQATPPTKPPVARPAPAAQPAPGSGAFTNRDLDRLPATDLPAVDAPATKPASEADAGAKTYTNKDIDRYEPAPGSDPKSRPAARDEAAEAEAAERAVADAQTTVDELEQRLRSIRNPFLPRPELPVAEQQAWEGLDNAQRAARVEEQLAEARKQLALSVEALSKVRPTNP